MILLHFNKYPIKEDMCVEEALCGAVVITIVSHFNKYPIPVGSSVLTQVKTESLCGGGTDIDVYFYWYAASLSHRKKQFISFKYACEVCIILLMCEESMTLGKAIKRDP